MRRTRRGDIDSSGFENVGLVIYFYRPVAAETVNVFVTVVTVKCAVKRVQMMNVVKSFQLRKHIFILLFDFIISQKQRRVNHNFSQILKKSTNIIVACKRRLLYNKFANNRRGGKKRR